MLMMTCSKALYKNVLGFFGCKGWKGVIFFNIRKRKLGRFRQRIVNQSIKVKLLSARM